MASLRLLPQFLLISCTLAVVSARLLSKSNNGGGATVFPPSCNRIECPSFDMIDEGNGFLVRRYNSSEWISTSAITDISFVNATRTGFLHGIRAMLTSGQQQFQSWMKKNSPKPAETRSSTTTCYNGMIMSQKPMESKFELDINKGVKAKVFDQNSGEPLSMLESWLFDDS